MATSHPLKSVLSLEKMDDTSLALPSGSRSGQRSGQQRVLEQVQTMRRNRSKSSSGNGSVPLSPASPSYESVFIESSRSSNGTIFFGNGLSKPLSPDKVVNRQIVSNAKGPAMKKSVYLYEMSSPRTSSTAHYQNTNTSRSESGLAWQKSLPTSSVPMRRTVSNKNTNKMQRTSCQFVSSTRPLLQPQSPSQPLPTSPPVFIDSFANANKRNSQFIINQADVSKVASKPSVTDSTSKSKGDSGENTSSKTADITMKEAVEYLSTTDETYQHCGASYIQHNTFINDEAKQEVTTMNGIRPLVKLLRSPNSQVSCTAAAALRNLSFKNDKNKEDIQRHQGITEAVAALKDTDSVEMQKQLTGLLWNLSSSENLKTELLKSALPVLVDHVVLPYTTESKWTNRTRQDPDIFFNATGCLRNLSSAKQSGRQAMRKYRGLIDSLATYVHDCVESDQSDDESVENCVGILHNLTFQLESEAPSLFTKMEALSNSRSNNPSNSSQVGCFSPQSKSVEHGPVFDYPVIDVSQPSGAEWLFNSKLLNNYLSLLRSSKREETQEACCGALQNLTAQNGIVSNVMAQTIVQRLKGLQTICPLIKSNKVNLQKNIVNLVGNFTKNPDLHNDIAHGALPDLLMLITDASSKENVSDDTVAMACQTASCMFMNKPKVGQKLLSGILIRSLNDLRQKIHLPKSSKAAAVLLNNIWSQKDLPNHLRKLRVSES